MSRGGFKGRIWPVGYSEFEDLLKEAQAIHNESDEPIPAPFPDNVERVKSCLEMPFATFAGEHLYKGFAEKAAILFYLLIKNHPLQNGNKRMAIITLAYFFQKNGREYPLTEKAEYALAHAVAESEDKDIAIALIKRLIK